MKRTYETPLLHVVSINPLHSILTTSPGIGTSDTPADDEEEVLSPSAFF